jgi:hypothetical protein
MPLDGIFGTDKQTAERGKDAPVKGSIPDACVKLALENPHLVPEHQDLDVSVGLGPAWRRDEEPAQAEADERKDHRRWWPKVDAPHLVTIDNWRFAW